MKQGTPIKVWPVTDKAGNHTPFGQYNLYPMGVQFNNGDAGQFNVKDPDVVKFTIGQLAHYDITPNSNSNYPPKITHVNPDFVQNSIPNNPPPAPAMVASSVPTQAVAQGPGMSKDELIVRQTCIKAATEYHAGHSSSNPLDVIAAAKMFAAYCLGKEEEPPVQDMLPPELKPNSMDWLNKDVEDKPPF